MASPPAQFSPVASPSKDKSDEEQDLDESLTILREYLSEEKLKEQTQTEDLSSVTYLEILVNLSDHSLSSLGEKLPSLIHLKLNSSVVPTIRDLGTSLRNLQVIWLNRCALKDLDGIHALKQLKELYLAYNDIEDISPLESLEHLQILDLEANRIDDLAQLMFLQDLPHLDSLTLEDNDCVLEAGDHYEEEVLHFLPQLEYLDDMPVKGMSFNTNKDTDNSSHNVPPKRPMSAAQKHSSKLDKDEIEMLKNAIKYTRVDEDEELLVQPRVVVASDQFLSNAEREKLLKNRPSTANPSTKRRSSTPSLQISASSFQNRPQSARPKHKPSRPITAFGLRNSQSKTQSKHHASNNQRNKNQSKPDDSSSELTYGSNQIFAGNIVKNLRSRKAKRVSETPPVAPTESSFDIYDFNGDMLEEVMAYKLGEARKQQQLDEEQQDVENRFISDDFQQISTSEIPLVNDDEYFPAPDNSNRDGSGRNNARGMPQSVSSAVEVDERVDRSSRQSSRRRSRSRQRGSPHETGRSETKRKSKSKRPRPKNFVKSTSPSENIPPNHREIAPLTKPRMRSKHQPLPDTRRSSASRSQLRSVFEQRARERGKHNV